MITNFDSDHEYEEERFYECLECDEPVTNPLCPDCLKIELQAWLTNYPNLGQKLLPKLNQYLNQLKKLTKDTTQCIHCNKKATSLCPYCFTEYTLNELKRLKINKQILKEFLQFFNFNFEYSRHIKDTEKQE